MNLQPYAPARAVFVLTGYERVDITCIDAVVRDCF